MPNIPSNECTPHTLHLDQRTHTEITGVIDVISFDERAVLLVCDGFELELSGEGLHVSVLDTDKGRTVIDGTVNAVYYSDKKPAERRGFFSKLAR